MTEPSAAAGRPPRLAYVYHPRSFGTFDLIEAAGEACELVWIVDTTDPETALMKKLLRRLGQVVDVTDMPVDEAAVAVAATDPHGLLALNDENLVWAAELAVRLGRPFLAPAVAHQLTDKLRQREALQAGGIPVPPFWTVPDLSDRSGWQRLEQEVHFPAMLKPRRSEGSKHVVKVGSAQELRSAVAQVPDEARPMLMLEGYLPDRERRDTTFADYVSVETIVSRSQVSHLAVTGRFPPAEPFRESGFFIPSTYGEREVAMILDTATAAVRAIGVEQGSLHTEIKLTPAGPRVIELNGRPGGGVSEMLEDLTGQSLLRMTLLLALGHEIVFDEMPRCEEVAFLFYVHAPAWMTEVRRVGGLTALQARPGVSEVKVNRGPGADVSWRAGNHGHVISVQGKVPDHAALLGVAQAITEHVQIEGERA